MVKEYIPTVLPGCEEMIDESTGEVLSVHPIAALFPMMSDEELEDLAADIKANGLIHPIIRDADGQLIDGRNRFKACEIAGVESRFAPLPVGADPVAFILSVNVARCHLTQGQKAMAVARACKLSLQAPTRSLGSVAGTSHQRIHQARTVLEYAPELTDAVMSAGLGLNDAYRQAQDRKSKADSVESRMDRLRAEAPDLADLVIEGRLEITDAINTLDRKQREKREARERATTKLSEVLLWLDPQSSKWTPEQWAHDRSKDVDWYARPHDHPLSPARIRQCAAALTALAAQLEAD